MTIKRGEIYFADLNPVQGREQVEAGKLLGGKPLRAHRVDVASGIYHTDTGRAVCLRFGLIIRYRRSCIWQARV